ncbi:DNA cytosine methyltransferase [Candidatus Poseidoniales archaeon]|nr:DNA cytosine methyltransferase [Candidatus Poseidoniales archaeon]
MANNKPTLVDLFAGCGGVALGFHNAGFETLLANEMHPDPAETYRKNLLVGEEERMIVGPMQKVLQNKHIDQLGIKPFEVDCVAGGPPCQGFSNAGPNIATDPRNKLYRQYLRVIRKIKPKSLFFENVPGFTTRYGLNLQEHLVKSLENLGYRVASGKVFSCFYGVPQLRQRFILIGVHEDFTSLENISLPKGTWSLNQINKHLTCENVIGDLNSYTEYGGGVDKELEHYKKPAKTKFQREMREISGTTTKGSTMNTKIPKHGKTVIARFKKFLDGETVASLKGTDLETKKHSQRALSADKFPKMTVVSIPDDYVHYDVNMPRTFSVRECARLQTFPDDFHIYGKRTSGGERRKHDCPQYTQVGNAVPPKLAYAFAMELLKFMNE